MASQPPSRVKNLTLAVMAGQAGCASLVFIVVALLIGIWLDARFGVRGPFTVGLLLLSIPLSLFVMVRIALGTIKQIEPGSNAGVRKHSTDTEEE
jgi:hypothetical protein